MAQPPPPLTAELTPLYSRVPMPRPQQNGAPYFEGTNVTRFLEEFKDLCNEYGLTAEALLRKLPLYCDQMIGDTIVYSNEFQLNNYEGVKSLLRCDFHRHDRAQTIYTFGYLDELCRKMSVTDFPSNKLNVSVNHPAGSVARQAARLQRQPEPGPRNQELTRDLRSARYNPIRPTVGNTSSSRSPLE
ncbi:hypothetical protein AAP_02401 [Ascosphaera apis ARSEF 7405]|uniref:Uncharacterized protein n=1 Tax=Ascosphaera apis ARSEF 7405 TaxID=392613 RepID=A0A168A8J8_9EURO|nr:hypothetical protein AAP_02401 [Ascosphaera apis ARSEF 7405]